MANTRYLRVQVEEYVRDTLARETGIPFEARQLELTTGGTHEFDAVARDGSLVAAIKTASGRTSGGRIPSGKIKDCVAELYYLTLVEAPARRLILTTPEFHALFLNTMDGKIPPSIEVVLLELPSEIQREVDRVKAEASSEVSPRR